MASIALPATIRMPRRAVYRAYLTALLVPVMVVFANVVSMVPGAAVDVGSALLLVVVLAVLADTPLFTVQRSDAPAGVSGSILLIFAIALAWGRGTGLSTQIVALVIGGLIARRGLRFILFDIGRYGLALYIAGRFLRLGGRPFDFAPADVAELVVVLAAAAAWFVAFHVLTTTEAWLRTGESWRSVSRRHILPEATTAVPLLLLAPLLVAVIQLNPWLMVLILAPMYAVSRMNRLAYQRSLANRTDPLTGLANRTELNRRVTGRTRRSTAPGTDRGFALLLLDLDRFRYVNEALGHEVGDHVLAEVAQRLPRAVGAGATVARLGGDEFGILVPGEFDTDRAAGLGRAVSAVLADPVLVGDLPLDVGASIGVATYPADGTDFTTLLRHADSAMYSAKLGSDAVAVYQPRVDGSSAERLRLVGDLRRALRDPHDTELQMCYQPQVAMDTGALVGVEALLRWRRPGQGAVSPEEVTRAAEYTGVMGLLTERVVDEVLGALVWWSAQDLYLRASINISVRDLYGPGLPGWLAERLCRYDISPGQVQLEITESAVMADPDRVLANLQRLHEVGVGVSLDDFGTGYSSLVHLRRLPVSEVKVDRSFVGSMADKADDHAIVRSVIGLARELGIRVVAEGVEDEHTARMLNGHGCHLGQGWLYAPAMPAEELPGWLARYRTPHRVLEAATTR